MTCIYWKDGTPVTTEFWTVIPLGNDTHLHVYDASDPIMSTGVVTHSTIKAGRNSWNQCSIEDFPAEFRTWLLVNNYT